MTFGINGLNMFGSWPSLNMFGCWPPFVSWQQLGGFFNFANNFSPLSCLLNVNTCMAVPFFRPTIQLPTIQPNSIFNTPNFNIQNPLQSIGDISNNNNNTGQAVSLAEIESAGLKFARPGRDRARWSQMNPKFQSDLLKLLNFARSKGITVTMVSGLRTQAEQQHLLASGAPAAPKGSLHLTGRAIDIRVSGNRSQNLAILGNYWKSLGNRWGKDFRKVSEPWHFDIGRTG